MIARSRPLPALGLLLSLASGLFAQDVRLTDKLDQVARAEIEKQKLIGTAVGVVTDGQIVMLKGYGDADREAKAPVDPLKSSFRWASCSKPVTAIAALQLAEAKKLDLDADVRKYVPEFPDKGASITARQLLCHQGGIVHYTNGKVLKSKAEYASERPFDDVVTALDTFKESPLVNDPGEKYAYSTHGYILLSAVVQRAGKQRFQDQVRERIAGPLKMTTFRPDRQWETIPDRVAGYLRNRDDVNRRLAPLDPDVSWKLGGGGYTSTVEDFVKFAMGLLNHKLVSSETEKLMWTRQKLANGKESNPYGLGFALGATKGGVKWVGHGGSQQKTRTAMLLVPDRSQAVVVMTNSEWGQPIVIATALLDAMNAK